MQPDPERQKTQLRRREAEDALERQKTQLRQNGEEHQAPARMQRQSTSRKADLGKQPAPHMWLYLFPHHTAWPLGLSFRALGETNATVHTHQSFQLITAQPNELIQQRM